jgi:hypothetical protein
MQPEKFVSFFKEVLAFYEKENHILKCENTQKLLEILPFKEELENRMSLAIQALDSHDFSNHYEEKQVIASLLKTIQSLTDENQKLIENTSSRYHRLFYHLCHLIRESEKKVPASYSPQGRIQGQNTKTIQNQHFISARM